jgi:hypothetical protein
LGLATKRREWDPQDRRAKALQCARRSGSARMPARETRATQPVASIEHF